MATLTDLALVAQVTVFGNKRAFDEIVRRYQSPVRRFFLHQTLGDSQLSDDLAQDTFIKAYLNIGKFRGLASFQTWLMRIAYNVFYDYVRKTHPQPLPKREGSMKGEATLYREGRIEEATLYREGSIGEFSPLPSREGLGVGLKMDLYTALAQLKPDERTCITLQLIDGYDIAGIAKITGLKAGTVKSHLSRGKEKLTNYLRQNGYDGK
ncbi:MAG: sigma-70 family RNA polymerase sigma factor [Prevotella sp.]|nr:sigma-70 family RNA polymerase sigma factor [Prevotella sp.]